MVAAAVAFIYYRRIRRNFGRQTISARRIIFRLVALSLFSGFLLVSPFTPVNAAAGGIALGAALGAWALRLTRFERVEDRLHYTPNSYIGLMVTTLLLGRVATRVFRVSTAASIETFPSPPAVGFDALPLFHGSWTRGILLVLLTHYITYYLGLLLRSRT